MRNHTQIVQDWGAAKLARDLSLHGVNVHISTPQRWADRNSIPGEYWATLVSLKAADLVELAEAASVRKADA